MNITCVKCGGEDLGFTIDYSGDITCYSCKIEWHRCTVHNTVVFKQAPSMNSVKRNCTCGKDGEYPLEERKAKDKALKKIHKYYGYHGVTDYP